VLRATALTLLAVVAARLLVRLMERTSQRGLAVAPDLAARFPMLEQRANRYLPVAIRLAAIVIYVLAALAVLQAWHISSFSWFATGVGRRVGGTVLSIVLVLALALIAWEMLAAAIERNLAALDHEGAPSRTRRRTLLPLLRTVIACVIVAIAALIVLSQIGIDIAPLLAGAGVIGVAIGFGSQALIKDIITGLFILVEDQIAVGDIVDVGKEHAGVVEAISIRTIRLRDQGGVVHTVPFSEVTSVKNLTKDFAYAVARVGIAYGENVDRVVDILRGVCDELAEDEEIGPLILDRFDYQGVDSLNEYSVVLLLRVKTLPGKQWVVGRALNRRIRDAFEQHGIAGRNPSPIIVTGPTAAILAAAAEPAQTADRGDPPAEEPIGAPQRRSA
jgi:moderate conductance mechanosensitive channel